MIATVRVTEKRFGNLSLYKNLNLTIQKGEKVAVIGRNGVGKSTLFHLMAGTDADFDGDIIFRRGTVVASTRQEHHDVDQKTAVEYILQELPEYAKLKHTIETYPGHMGEDTRKITHYTEALDRFGELGFYHVEDEVRTTLGDYQIGDKADAKLIELSGGQRRFVELVKLSHARADLLLIDEPTNHMDFVAKEQFIKWFRQAKQAILVITHDRDVLHYVDRIVEIIDGEARSFPGNYDAYLQQNSLSNVSAINSYETALKALEQLDKQIAWARARKPGYAGKAKKNPYVVMENRLLKQRADIADKLDKPSFWVDKDSLQQLDDTVVEKYHKYKTKNIRVSAQTGQSSAGRTLLSLENVSLGYDDILFENCTFVMNEGDRVELRGRNGAGKSTLINAIVSQWQGGEPKTLLEGEIIVSPKCRIGRYEQEIDAKYLDRSLGEAIEAIYRDLHLPCSDELVMRILSDYLFDPQQDKSRIVGTLSGGQKARLQLIRMLAGKPNMLILDEPTNHLDLPSIEELETALARYDGAILYVSHDSYFQKHLGGEVVHIGKSNEK